MKTSHIFLCGFAALSLSACSTFEGFKSDLSNFGSTVNEKVSNISAPTTTDEAATAIASTAIISDGDCPPIDIDPQFNEMSEFYNPDAPKEGEEISTITLNNTKSECAKDGEYLDVKIELDFAGALGPKAKRKENDQPFFAYPYFIAVTDNEGEELAKELFAASVTYESNQEKIQLVETIRQRLPLNEDGTTPAYRIKIGFQLTEAQLFFNAARGDGASEGMSASE